MKWFAAFAFLLVGAFAPQVHAGVSKPIALSPTSNLSKAFFANKFVVPKRPMWQRTYGTLVDLTWRRSKKKQKRVASVTPDAVASKRKAALPRGGIVPTKPPKANALHHRIKLPSNHLRIAAGRKKNAEELREERRASLAKWHQITGIATLALLTATVVIGQINAVDFLQDRLSPLPMIWAHRALSTATGLSYLTGGILALMFPKDPDDDDDDDDEPSGFDSSIWHKALAWVHGMGMLGLFVSGIINAHFIPSFTDAKVAFTVGHLALGYLTLAVLAAAAIMITFF